jgi:hypothetical protein
MQSSLMFRISGASTLDEASGVRRESYKIATVLLDFETSGAALADHLQTLITTLSIL